jgi:hypothetical protein
MLSKEDKEKTISFILQYEQPNGGFSFSKTTPPTREDTYYALLILHKLDKKYCNKNTFNYLENISLDLYQSCKHYYQLLCLADMFKLSVPQDTMKNVFELNINLQKENINEVYYFTLIREFLESKVEYELTNFILSQNISSLKYIPEVARQVILLKKFKLKFDNVKYINWIQKSQSRDGGFGFLPYTTTFLENTCYALRGLRTLNAIPLELEKCEEFINSCKTGKGAFARKSEALGTLQSTYHAICCLEIIHLMNIQGAIF